MTVARSDAASLAVQLEDTWASLVALGRQLDDGGWAASTRCPGWDVAAHYAHVLGVEAELAARPAPPAVDGAGPHVRNDQGVANESWVAAYRHRPRTELLDELEALAGERLAAVRALTPEDLEAPVATPVGRAGYGRLMQIRVFDCWVHEQDVRSALDRPGHADGPAAEQAIDEIERSLGYIVAKRAGVAPGTVVGVALRGPVVRELYVEVPAEGRAVAVDEAPRTPDTVLRLDSGTFVALACGRETLGRVVVDGDQDLGRRVIERLAFTI